MRCLTSAFVLLNIALVCSAKEFYDKLDRFIIACHSTDFECFKKQYQYLRDNVLLGSPLLGVDEYEPYYFQYGDSGTCIKLSGMEESRLVGIGIDSDAPFYTLTLELPLNLQQVGNESASCAQPTRKFHDIDRPTGPLKRFAGNATIEILFPYDLKKKKGQTYMILGEEGLDVILDIPDLTDYQAGTEEDRQQYELSEWAYEIIQHVDAAKEFALPYTGRFRTFAEKIALERYLLLYPEEEYTDIHFNYNESPFFDASKGSILFPKNQMTK